MKYAKFTISAVVPVPAASSLGGNNSNKGLSKIDREVRYFLNAIIRRGGLVVSEEQVNQDGSPLQAAAPAAPAPVAKAAK